MLLPDGRPAGGYVVSVVGTTRSAVCGSDGTFTLENLPPGTYTIEAWHELYGTQTQTVTVAAQGTGQVTFDYSSDMAGNPVPMGDPIDLHEHDGHPRVASAGR